MMKHIFYCLILPCLFYLSTLCAERIPITLKHAVTADQLSQGLMGHKSLAPNEGMTFNFPFPQTVTFWMYNCYIDLAVAFLDSDKVIREIHEMKAYPNIHDKDFFHNHSVTPAFPVAYVLEMNAAWFTKHNVRPGAHAHWDLNTPEGWIDTSTTSSSQN